jgi:PAS domain S-box-containing protein
MDDTALDQPGVIGADQARAFLERAGAVLQSSLDFETTLAHVAGLAVPDLADWCAVDVVEDDGSLRQITSGTVEPDLEALLLELRRRYRRDTGGSEGVLRVIERGEPELATDVTDAPRLEIGPSERPAYERLHPRSYMIVPLLARDRVLGALTVLSIAEGRHYGPADLEFAGRLAHRCALAVDNARLYREAGQTIGLLDALFSTAPVGLAYIDPAGRFRRVNSRLADLHGMPVATHLGRWPDEVAGKVGAARARLHRRVLASGEPILEHELAVEPGGRTWLVSVTPVPAADGTMAGALETVIDVTEHRALLQRERAGRQRAALLARAGEVLEGTLDFDATLRNVAHVAVPDFCDWCAVYILDEDELRTVAVAHADPERERWAWELNARYPPDATAATGPARVIRSGEPEVTLDINDDMLVAAGRDEEHLRLLRELELTGSVLVPLRARGRTLGAIAFLSAESGRRFGPDDVALAIELGRRAGMAVENARLYTARAAIAHTLQAKLLPGRLPRVPGVELAARYRAAGEFTEVGGDFYDVVPCADGDHIVVVGDVTGKGAEAAAVTALARYTLRAAVLHASDPVAILRVLNNAIRAQDEAGELLCTVGLARVAIHDGHVAVRLVLAGHEPALVARASGEVEEAGRYGSLLGFLDEPQLEETELELGPGDTLLLHTDGVTDAGAPGHALGATGLHTVLRSVAGRGPAAVVDAVERAAVEAQEGEPRDDIAMVALRMAGGMAPPDVGSPSRMSFTAVDVPGGPQAPAHARRALTDRLAGSVSPSVLEDAGLLVSELVTNSVLHGGVDAGGQVSLRVGVDGQRVRIEVSDAGPGFEPGSGADAGAEDLGGYGLFLVTQIADAWGIAPGDEPTKVWFELSGR